MRLVAWVLLLLTGWAGAEPFVDAHAHLNNLARQLRLMDAQGIEKAVVFLGGQSSNDDVLKAAQQHPARLIPFVSVSPEKRPYAAWWKAGDSAAVVGELERRLAGGGFRGVGELNIVHFPSANFPETEYSPLHPINLAIFELMARRFPNLPVMLHCEVTYVKELSELLARFPQVKVLWAHAGYAPLFLTERMLARHPNLTMELSMRTFENHPRSPDYWILRDRETVWPGWLKLIERHPQRFVVGTDSSNRSEEQDARKARSVSLLLAQLTPATRRLVARDNLLRLLP